MNFVFVRQHGKVFGPFAADRLQAAITSGKFDSSAEYASKWDGPWGPLSKLQLQDLPAGSQPGTPSAPPAQPAVQSSPQQASLAPPLTHDAVDDEDDAKFFGTLTEAARSHAASGKEGLPFSLPIAVAAAGGVLAAGAVVIAAIVIFGGGGRSTDAPSVDTPAGADTVGTTNADSFPSLAERPSAIPTQQAAAESSSRPSRRAVTTQPAPAAPMASSRKPATPPTGGPQPAEKIPEEAEEAVKSLRALRASIDIGISFEQYTGKLQSLLPAVKLFLESREAQQVPELAALLTNATDCYVAVKQIWNDSIFESSPTAKADATALLADTRTRLWEIAEWNVEIAYDLTSPEPDVRARGLQRAAADSASLRPNPVLEAARRALAERRPPLSPPPPARPSPATQPPFNPRDIDVRALRAMAKTLEQRELTGDEAELVDQLLTLTRSREWQTRQGEKSWGDAITIYPDSVRLATKKGDGTIPRMRLSEASQKVLDRIEELAEKLHNLSNRPAPTEPSPSP